jgi:hypothetical protein
VRLDRLSDALRGGYRGNVKNLRSEGGRVAFWLVGAGKAGSDIQVEGNAPEGSLGEGDIVWVRGRLDTRGVVVMSEIQNRSKIEAQRLESRKGESEFSGVVVGGTYELKSKMNALGAKKVELMCFRVQRVDASGNPLETIEVEMKGDKYRGIVFDRDQVKVRGTWQSSGRLQLTEIYNMTSKATTRLGRFT